MFNQRVLKVVKISFGGALGWIGGSLGWINKCIDFASWCNKSQWYG